MKKYLLLWILCVMLFGLFASTLRAEPKKYALVIGNDHYFGLS